MGNSSILGNILEAGLARLFPAGWSFELDAGDAHRPFDAVLAVSPPSGRAYRFVVETKARFEPRDVDSLIHLCKTQTPDRPVLLVAPYLSARSRHLLRDQRICFIDGMGNVWLSNGSLLIDRVAVHAPPAVADPSRPRSSLRGPVTGRVVRYLCDTLPPLKVRGIASETKAHAGNISRILALLESERLITRAVNGSVVDVDWEPLIRKWGEDLKKERKSRTYLEPRGVVALTSVLSKCSLDYAITGSFASAQLAPVVEPIAIDIYVVNIEEARLRLSLRQSEHVGNVQLIQAFDRVVFERTVRCGDLILASPSQIAADLVTLRKRSSDELSEFINWMMRHVSEWRRAAR